jgi:ribosomal protein L7/L12
MGNSMFVTCTTCGGHGRVLADDAAGLAAECWQVGKNSDNKISSPIILAIRELRTRTGCSLREAKDLIEAARDADLRG